MYIEEREGETLKLYLIERDPGDVGYDEAAGFVIAAENEHQVRSLIRLAHEGGGPGGEGSSSATSGQADEHRV